MIKRMLATLAVCSLCLGMAAVIPACEEKPEDKAKDAVEDAGDAAKDAADKLTD